MTILIDGYNLLYVRGIPGRDDKALERARNAMLDELAERLTAEEIAKTTIVFDARHAPWGLPRQHTHRGLNVRFAADYEEADDLIEELIRTDNLPKQLTVVSGDHRLHRAAKRRKATPIDADTWYGRLEARAVRAGREPDPPEVAKPAEGAEELRNPFPEGYAEDVLQDEDRLPARPADEPDPPPGAEPAKPVGELWNPFPEGYAEDMLQDEDRRQGGRGRHPRRDRKRGG